MRRTQETHVGLRGQRNVVNEPARADEQFRVFDAPHLTAAAKPAYNGFVRHSFTLRMTNRSKMGTPRR